MLPEILAPAGNAESFLCAVEAGADAVYAGVSAFNARMRAKNFDFSDLAIMTDYAHRNNVQVHVPFNILIKQDELNSALEAINKIVQAKVDAFIIQDLAVLKLLKTYFPKVKVHASTQMAIHNSAGALILEDLGFDRVVLARELSAEEIETIKKRTKLEIEVFVHGALCFSFSGMCLASSCIGGGSGNRGLCAQPCRRLWENRGIEKYFFSDCDLDASRFVEFFKKNKIDSLKIEGRMKSLEYTSRAVSFWKSLVTGQPLPESENFSRKKTDYYISGGKGAIINSSLAPSVGQFAGFAKKFNEIVNITKLENPICEGDMVRLIGKGDEEKLSLRITELSCDNNFVSRIEKGNSCSFKCAEKIDENDFFKVYISGRPVFKSSDITRKLKKIYATAKRFNPTTRKFKNLFEEFNKNTSLKVQKSKNHLLFVKVANLDKIEQLKKLNSDYIITRFDPEITPEEFKKKLANFPFSKIILAPNIFIPEQDLKFVSQTINKYFNAGFKNWYAENMGHLSIIPKSSSIYAGAFLYATNSLSLRVFKDLNIKCSVSSYEDDFLNIRNRSRFQFLPSIYPLFAYIPAFTSRATVPHFFANGEEFKLDKNFSLSIFNFKKYMVASFKKPLSIFQAKKKLAELNPYGFLIDIEYMPSDLNFKKMIDEISQAYNFELPFKNSDKYNFKRGLK